MQSTKYLQTLNWYLDNLGMIVSDFLFFPGQRDRGPTMSFIRCDRGLTPADHHTLALALGPANRYVHSAYQVSDLDALAAGGEFLRERGYFRSWGIGRHIQGSQIFDYWRDPDGYLFEHFADGDLFDNTLEPGWAPFTASGLAQWGPPASKDFLGTDLKSARHELVSIAHRLARTQRIRYRPLGRTTESAHLMTVSVLRTSDAWWVKTANGAAKIDTTATSTAGLLADPAAIEAAATSVDTVQLGRSAIGLAGDQAVPGDSPDDQLRVARQRRRHGPVVGSTDLLPQGVGVDQRPVRRHRQTATRQAPRLRGGDRAGDRRTIPVGTSISEANLGDFIAGLVVTNDVSARDVQLPQTQFYEAKSYPTFTPVGPELVLLSADELKRFGDLRLRLSVNGDERQNALVDPDMLYRPLQALQSLTQFQELAPGDLVLTGTPAGTALSAPPKPLQIIGNLLPPNLKWKVFFSRQADNTNYLHDGDIVEASIGTDDGAIDLGTQRATVRFA